jgi:hypothetical protein
VGNAYGRVEVDENGARNIFAAAGLCEEGLEGATALGLFLELWIRLAVGFQAMLEEIAAQEGSEFRCLVTAMCRPNIVGGR